MLLVGFRGANLARAAGTIADIRDRGLGGVLLFDGCVLAEHQVADAAARARRRAA
jgi:hypothetical protein